MSHWSERKVVGGMVAEPAPSPPPWPRVRGARRSVCSPAANVTFMLREPRLNQGAHAAGPRWSHTRDTQRRRHFVTPRVTGAGRCFCRVSRQRLHILCGF